MKLQEALKDDREGGFTLIELLIALAIIGITIIGSISLYGRLQVSAQLNEQTTRIVGALRTAHLRALIGKGGASHGVYFDINPIGNDRIVTYQGSSYAGRVPQADLIENAPDSIQLSLQLSTSTPEVIFSRSTGAVSATGTIILTLQTDTRTISINRLGIVDSE